MYFEDRPYRVYVKINSEGYITDVSSSAFLVDTADWIEIDSGFGDKFHHAQRNYFPESIVTDASAHRYRLVNGTVTACAGEEIAAQEKANVTEKTSLEERVNLLEKGAAEMKKMITVYFSKTTQE